MSGKTPMATTITELAEEDSVLGCMLFSNTWVKICCMWHQRCFFLKILRLLKHSLTLSWFFMPFYSPLTSTCQQETCLFQFFWNLFLSLCWGVGDGVLLLKPRSTTQSELTPASVSGNLWGFRVPGIQPRLTFARQELSPLCQSLRFKTYTFWKVKLVWHITVITPPAISLLGVAICSLPSTPSSLI